jgi:hypothetical protein
MGLSPVLPGGPADPGRADVNWAPRLATETSKAKVTDMKFLAPWQSGFMALCAGCLCMPAWAEKTDVVVLINGDRITGEVKQLSYGQLKFKTDHMGTIYIEWDKIASLSTNQVLQVETTDGGRYDGRSPEPGKKAATLRLVPIGKRSAGQAIDLPMDQIVRMAYLEQGNFIDRLDGAVSVGYNYTQATEVEQFNFSGNFGTRNSKRKWNVALDTNMSSQAQGPSSQRATLSGTFEKFLPDRYYYESTLSFTQNDELGLDLRGLFSGTAGRYLIQRQGMELRAGAGLSVSRENFSDGTTVDSLELPLTTSFTMFRLDSPKTDVTLELTVLPSLTESGRVRGEASISARHEIVSDLFFEISLYDSYDNRVPEGSSVNDWNVVTSLGYSF